MAANTTNQVSNASSTIADKASSMYQDTQKMVGQVGQQLMDTGEEFRSQISDYSDEATEWVKENPVKSVLIGFGVGCVAGLLLARPWQD